VRGVPHLALHGVRLPPPGPVTGVGFWHWLVHWTGCDYGLRYGKWSFYGFWSGFGSDIAEVTIIAGLVAVYRKHACHVRGCPRIGHHPFTDEATGAVYVLCRKHHPRVPDAGVTAGQLDSAAARARPPSGGYHGHGDAQG
jgi:hypothetical protein